MNTQIQKDINEHPVSMYLNNLQSPASKKTMALALRRALASKENPISNISSEDVYNFPWPTITKAEVLALKASLVKKYSEATSSQTLTAVKAVMGACFDLEMIDGDTLKRIERISNPKVEADPTVGKYVKREDIEKLKAVMVQDEAPAGKRDLAILAWLWSMGCRVGELCGASLSDWNRITGKLIIRHGKGGKIRENQLHNKARNAMNDWINERGTWPGALFVALDKWGNPIQSDKYLSTHTITKMLEKRQRQAGVDKFSPHSLRRTAATDLIAQHGIRVAQIVLGHTEISTTARYDRGDKDKAFELAGERQF